jgi:hypothetical protein
MRVDAARKICILLTVGFNGEIGATVASGRRGKGDGAAASGDGIG